MNKTTIGLCIWLLVNFGAEARDYSASAFALDATIQKSYAYLEKLPGGILPKSAKLDEKRAAVNDANSLLRYAEDRIMSLADHHAITGSSFLDSWAVIPTYADLWIINRGGRFMIDAVRNDSPAYAAGVKAGEFLVAVDQIEIAAAVANFWSDLGLALSPDRAEFAARVLVAGRRDKDRQLSIADATGNVRQLTLPSLYSIPAAHLQPISTSTTATRTVVRINNSLGNAATIAAFDQAMQRIPRNNDLVLDLRNTPSGGNTTVARAVMGWFVKKARGYQVHNRPSEERETGIARQWQEQVLPRKGKYRGRLPTIWVGRWTGSMGEGLAIGFSSLGADVRGGPMAELNGAVEDIRIGNSDIFVKLPTERLLTTTYKPREDFRAKPMR